MKKPIPYPTIKRFPLYMQIIEDCIKKGEKQISSSYIAKQLNKEGIQVRKDLAFCSVQGSPRVGFNLIELRNSMRNILGWDRVNTAFLVGAGNLGKALAKYKKFSEYGMKIDLLFDITAKEIIYCDGLKILPIEKFEDLAKRLHIRIGIITVPENEAQEIANLMIKSGLKAIWNFSNTKLTVPENIIVENVDLTASLAILYNKLEEREE